MPEIVNAQVFDVLKMSLGDQIEEVRAGAIEVLSSLPIEAGGDAHGFVTTQVLMDLLRIGQSSLRQGREQGNA